MGQVLGTPQFMAPEQAAGRLDELGPSSDVYSLGATLYCLLTGKAPFEGPDVGIILQRVQSGRFPAPRVVKRQVPPGLEAICLKAMALKSQDRYSSPRALADDIEHWLADEPVAAYHEPLWARVARWIRHHQTLVSASTAAVVVAIIGGGVAAFLWERQHARQQAEQAHRDSQTRQAVALALAEVKSFQERARWEEARVTLQQAASRLVEGQAEDLHNQVEQAKRDLEIVARCDAISQKGAAMLREGLNFGAVDQDYAVAFQEAGLGTLSDAPSTVAERVRASAVRERLVAALDYWAMTAREPAHRRWVFDVVRLADPDPWRDQARDPAIWTNVAALVKLVRAAPFEQWTPQLLAIVGTRLREHEEGKALLRRAQQRFPDDFWVNFALGLVIEDEAPEEALGCYRAALALRPATPALRNSIGEVLYDMSRTEESLLEYEQAISLDSQFANARYNFGRALRVLGRLEEARDQFRQAAALGYKRAIGERAFCEKLMAMRLRLPTVLAGKEEAGSRSDRTPARAGALRERRFSNERRRRVRRALASS